MKYANQFVTEFYQKKLPLIDRIIIYDCKTGQELYEAWGRALVSIYGPLTTPDVLMADTPDLHSPTPQYAQKTIDEESYNTIYIDKEVANLSGIMNIKRAPDYTVVDMDLFLGFFKPQIPIQGREFFDEHEVIESANETYHKAYKTRTAEDFAMVLRRAAALYTKASDMALERYHSSDEELIKKTRFGVFLPFFSKLRDGYWKAGLS